MKKTFVIFSLAIFAAILSFKTGWFNYVLIIMTVLSIATLLLVGLLSIFKNLNNRAHKVPIYIILICVIGIITSLFRPYNKAIIKSENIEANLKYAYETDQSDRKELRSYVKFISKLDERDSLRLSQVKDIYSENKITDPLNQFHAAFIFHHSNNSADYKIASGLASQAARSKVLESNLTAQWLKKAAYDRFMLSIGKQEKYKTQNKFSFEIK
ncbi:hypothetical protein ACNKXS_13875 [Christiangramia marina]|uniref:hypothetical protein n=1 Tax=Christiangramia marina TaxID=409436 RepID=UPI003AA9C96D